MGNGFARKFVGSAMGHDPKLLVPFINEYSTKRMGQGPIQAPMDDPELLAILQEIGTQSTANSVAERSSQDHFAKKYGPQYFGFSKEMMQVLFPNDPELTPDLSADEATAPRERVIMGQPHALAYINPEEERMLMEEGGQGTMTKEGIPAYWTITEPSTWGDGRGYEGVGDFNAGNNRDSGHPSRGPGRGGSPRDYNHPDAGNSSDNDTYTPPVYTPPVYVPPQPTAAEIEASKNDLAYIKLNGSIGCMVNGAGLAMATMDIIKLYGEEPANFLDVGGGASKEKVSAALKIILSDRNVKGILINIFGGIMRCDVLAQGVVDAAKEINISVPLVVRLAGTNFKEGKEILDNSELKLISAENLDDAAKKIVEAIK